MRTLYRASRVHTMGHPRTGEWLLVDGRHVQRVGSGEPPGADRVVELPGATIMPGFVDSHVHLTGTGLAVANLEVVATRSKTELLTVARGRATDREPVILLQGYDESTWETTDLPTLAELDAVGDTPLVIRRTDGHLALVNSAALAAAQALDQDGCERDAQGNPTGRVTRVANVAVARWIAATRTEHRIEELQLAGAALAASRGVTAIHQMAMPAEEGEADLEVFLRHRAKLPVDAVPIVATTDIPRVIDLGLGAIGGDLPADGSIGARTAALVAPYQGGDDRGSLYLDDDHLAELFHGGHNAGLQVGIHAIGDRAIEQVLSAWERVYSALDSRERRHFRARRHRIEHLEMPSEEQIERAASLGLGASVQPAFDAAWGFPGGLYEAVVGPERAVRMNPFRSLLERGVVVGAGSDSPITPLDPWLAVTALERHHDPAQRLTRVEAIRVHTAGSARLGHQEEKKGVLEPGMHADFAAYETDPLDDGPVDVLRPILTVSLGRDVFAAGAL